MEKKSIFNYISEENNAKISFCTSVNENYESSNILSSIENVRINKFKLHH